MELRTSLKGSEMPPEGEEWILFSVHQNVRRVVSSTVNGRMKVPAIT